MQKVIKALWVLMPLFSSGVRCEDEPTVNEYSQQNLNAIVYRTPTCGCCGKWVNYLKRNQFNVQDIITDEVDVLKNQLGVKKSLASCHTAIINGYVVEGHVPINDIKEMLKNKPEIVGISVPGMVVGTPGMEMGNQINAYKVLSFDDMGAVSVFNQYDSSLDQ